MRAIQCIPFTLVSDLDLVTVEFDGAIDDGETVATFMSESGIEGVVCSTGMMFRNAYVTNRDNASLLMLKFA